MACIKHKVSQYGKVIPVHAMKAQTAVEVQVHAFLTSALDRSSAELYHSKPDRTELDDVEPN